MQLSPTDFLAIERELCSRSLAAFAKRAWPILEPAADLAWGWPLDAVCMHLEAVTDGRIPRLLINIPPGMMKSLLVGVIWPAWEWGPKNLKDHRFLGTAHSQTLAIRDAMKCRRLIQSEWFQTRWPTPLTSDQNSKTKFENDRTGFREAMAFQSMTGSRGDRVILDDPLSVDDAKSEAELLAAEYTFTEALPTRLNNKKSAIVVIMQRLHERDTSGLILDRKLDFEHLCLPMRFEPDRRCVTSIGFKDPRTEDGELLLPDRFDEDEVARLERTMGSYAAAGQFQQRPAPRGGALFKREWFSTVMAVPSGCTWARGWDLAATDDKRAAYTAGVLIARTPDQRFIIVDVVRGQMTPANVRRLMLSTAEQDRTHWHRRVLQDFPQDPGQAGKAQMQDFTAMLAGFHVQSSPETGSKVTRAEPLAAQAEAGNVSLLAGEWNKDFLDEIEMFPMGKFMDQVDAASRGFNAVATPRKVTAIGVPTRHQQ